MADRIDPFEKTWELANNVNKAIEISAMLRVYDRKSSSTIIINAYLHSLASPSNSQQMVDLIQCSQ
jgi:hypothetical protein